jgi:hypothetical protein
MDKLMKNITVKGNSSFNTKLQLFLTVAVVILLVGAIFSPERIWANILVVGFWQVSVTLGALIVIALSYVVKAGWFVILRRIPEAIARAFPLGAVIILATAFGIHSLYEWSHTDVVLADPILKAKMPWLNSTFFIIRMVLCLGIWWFFINAITGNSYKQDEEKGLDRFYSNIKLSAIFLVVLAITFTVASFDWLMSIQPHWFSTIFGWYNFMGALVGGLAMVTMVAILLDRWGSFEGLLTKEHLHDLGKYLFAFSTFWAYLWFSQYILIWYANIPEETSYYILRHGSYWSGVSMFSLVLNWVVPFVFLMQRPAKRNSVNLLRVSFIILVGRWVDLYVQVFPPLFGETPKFGFLEFGAGVSSAVLLLYLVMKLLKKQRLIPVSDPMLEESIHHSQ